VEKKERERIGNERASEQNIFITAAES